MSVYDIFSDVAIASLFILVAQWLRSKVKFFQEFFVPASLIAGILGLIAGPQVLGRITGGSVALNFSSASGSYSGLLIIIVFTVVGLNGFEMKKGEGKEVLKRVGSYGCLRTFNMFIQFTVGIALTELVIATVMPNLSHGFGILLASGFTGGHGTAAAVGKTFTDLGWAEGADLGVTFATIGVILGVFGGVAFIKIATKKNWTVYIKDFKFLDNDLRTGMIAPERQKSIGREPISSVSLDSLAWHLALVCMVGGFGYLLNAKVLAPYVIKGIPDFTVSYLVALFFFLATRKMPFYEKYVDKRINSRISGTATDYLVFFAVAKLNLTVIVEYAVPLLVCSLGGLIIVVLGVIPLGAKLNEKSWFERSMFCYGYGTGVFAIGFVLLRILDPENRSHTVEDTAMFPFLSFAEVVLWSAIPVALLKGAGSSWAVAGICFAISIAALIIAKVLGWWFKGPLAGREGYFDN
ncbi:MAG: sodium:glutamate symporter [Lachnospiraceae bacterium]|nr:sodium:glutamate symporter [Lachnospiraceae bacterium]